jgi:hypothetical protein
MPNIEGVAREIRNEELAKDANGIENGLIKVNFLHLVEEICDTKNKTAQC